MNLSNPNEKLRYKVNIPGLPDGVIALFQSKGQLKYVTKNKTNLVVARQHFQCDMGACLTAYGAQGRTLDSGIIDLARPNFRFGRFEPSEVYVSFSRFKRWCDFAILRPFNKQVLRPVYKDEFIEGLNHLQTRHSDSISQFNEYRLTTIGTTYLYSALHIKNPLNSSTVSCINENSTKDISEYSTSTSNSNSTNISISNSNCNNGSLNSTGSSSSNSISSCSDGTNWISEYSTPTTTSNNKNTSICNNSCSKGSFNSTGSGSSSFNYWSSGTNCSTTVSNNNSSFNGSNVSTEKCRNTQNSDSNRVSPTKKGKNEAVYPTSSFVHDDNDDNDDSDCSKIVDEDDENEYYEECKLLEIANQKNINKTINTTTTACTYIDSDSDSTSETVLPRCSEINYKDLNISELNATEIAEHLLLQDESQCVGIKLIDGSLNWLSLRGFKLKEFMVDDAILYYLRILKRSLNSDNVFIMDTFFYEKLHNQLSRGRGYSEVQRWIVSEAIDLFLLDKLLIPINKPGQHWSLLVLDFSTTTPGVFWYDSLNSMYTHQERTTIVTEINGFMKAEKARCNNSTLDFNTSTYNTYILVRVPQQLPYTNDCGVFLVHFARCVIGNTDLFHYDQAASKQNRIKMLAELLLGRLF